MELICCIAAFAHHYAGGDCDLWNCLRRLQFCDVLAGFNSSSVLLFCADVVSISGNFLIRGLDREARNRHKS